MKVYFLIPTRNRKEKLFACLHSIGKQTYKDIEIVVVNDGSTDGTGEDLANDFKNITVLQGDGELWWTGAMRMGVSYLLPQLMDDDFVLIQNDDTYMEPDFVQTLIDEYKSTKAIIGTTVKDKASGKLIYNAHKIVHGSFRTTIVDSQEELLETDTISGRGVLIPSKVFRKIGNFSKLFPQYAADYDFFCRAKQAGFKLLVSTKAISYSTSNTPNLSKRIKLKEKISIKDVWQLFTNRRSSNNLWGSTMITLLYVPWKYKLYGILRIYLYVIKFVVVNWGINGIKFALKK
ncbi:glycosyltransferase family 2 protein [Patescibacteria group bacterium]|nr:glycosyltransferase family 2 protein [Patescibacteria group bacterium]